MDYALQIHNAKYVFPIPDGLKELSSDIIREVLRHQPPHINGFIADYLETMLQVRQQARDAGVVISDIFKEGHFYDDLFRRKNVTRAQVNALATLIQASWRGYVVRRKIQEWTLKKKKIQEEKEQEKECKILELLAGLGITYNEARRASEAIQAAFRESQQRGKWIAGELGEFWVTETVPFGQRLREGDRALGHYDRWEKDDFGEFFEMNEVGAIKYTWPRIGQLRKVLRDDLPNDVPVVEFYAMRDLEGKEQYSYLIKTPSDSQIRGTPLGFLIPKVKTQESEYPEVEFVGSKSSKQSQFVYVFRDDIKREELKPYEELLKKHQNETINREETPGEGEGDVNWALPRLLVRIKKDLLLKEDGEVKFSSLPQHIMCEQEDYTFRAETFKTTLKVIRHILRNPCLSVENGLLEASNMKPYTFLEGGRIFPVEKFIEPNYIQRINIVPESVNAEEESMDVMLYTYVFLAADYQGSKPLPKGAPVFSIPIIRFQGYHSDYKGSAGLENKVFIMGPRIATPNGKPFTYESLFWEEFGLEAWYQLLYDSEEPEPEDGLLRLTEALREDVVKTDTQKQKKRSEQSATAVTTGSKPLLTRQTSEEFSESEGEGKSDKQIKIVEEIEKQARTDDEEGEEKDNQDRSEEEEEFKSETGSKHEELPEQIKEEDAPPEDAPKDN